MKAYFNKPQQLMMYTGAKTTVFVGGRRLGKTHGVIAPFTIRNIQRMPRGTHSFVAPSYKRALTNTIPGTLSAMEQYGYKRDIHYFIGRKPPKSAGFPKPLVEPANYDYVISWYTGAIHHIISQDVPGSSNSFTLDSITGDEAKFLDFDKLKDETFPANGGTKAHFGHLPYHHSMLFVSDMPTTKKGSWFLGYKEKSDPEVIELIHGLIFEIWKIKDRIKQLAVKGVEPPKYLNSHLKSLYKSLNELRSIAVHYEEFSSIENLQVLGESYIKQMKRELPPLVFQTSILCKRVGNLRDGFYQNMKDRIHYYTAYNNDYLMSLEYQFDKIQEESCLQDGDLDRDAPIAIGMDYNANINWIVAAQPKDGRLFVLKSFYVKYERKLIELVGDFCKYYRHQRCKEVIYYYDTTALGSNYAVNSDDFMSVVCHVFELKGWTVTPVLLGNPLPHKEKHGLINMGFRGHSGLMPMINSQNNEELLLAMEQTGTRIGSRGFGKDKRGEKLAESEENKLEHRTDGTDAFDTVYIGCTKFPRMNYAMIMGSSVM